MWRDGILQIPNELWRAYEVVLRQHNLYDDCVKGTEKKEIYGGASEELTKEHFTHRFANSATRILYVVYNPDKKIHEISESISVTFSSHDIFLLDLAGGTGAASISMLIALCRLREMKVLPYLPLRFNIFAADYSMCALGIYNEMIGEVEAYCAMHGIDVNFVCRHWDAADAVSTNLLCNEWLKGVGDSEVFIVVNNLSGVGTAFADFERSFQHITERISHLPSSFLWLEPRGKGAKEFMKRVYMKVFKVASLFTSASVPDEEYDYSWRHKLQDNDKLIVGGVRVMRFVRSNI